MAIFLYPISCSPLGNLESKSKKVYTIYSDTYAGNASLQRLASPRFDINFRLGVKFDDRLGNGETKRYFYKLLQPITVQAATQMIRGRVLSATCLVQMGKVIQVSARLHLFGQRAWPPPSYIVNGLRKLWAFQPILYNRLFSSMFYALYPCHGLVMAIT
jgi:hypothetical protein